VDADGHVVDADLAVKWNDSMHTEADVDAPLLVPTTAPLLTGERAIVYVELSNSDGPAFEGREVELGPRAGDFYVVRSGLEEGELVVTNGAFRIDSELQIQARPSMMSPPEELASGIHGRDDLHEQRPTGGFYVAGSADRLENVGLAQRALMPVYEVYFDAQMALARDSLALAVAALGELAKVVADVSMSDFSGEAHTHWMRLAQSLMKYAEIGSRAETFEQIRDAFYYLSLAAIELHDRFGHSPDEPFYLTYCPMARDNTGAFWLQREEIVWNSYWGAEMLRCGEIRQELPAGDAAAE
jgi:Cu(I)/Ag(I) efflux system membrane fusion protein